MLRKIVISLCQKSSNGTCTPTTWIKNKGNKTIQSLFFDPSLHREKPKPSPPRRWKPCVKSDVGHGQQPPYKHQVCPCSSEEHCIILLLMCTPDGLKHRPLHLTVHAGQYCCMQQYCNAVHPLWEQNSSVAAPSHPVMEVHGENKGGHKQRQKQSQT